MKAVSESSSPTKAIVLILTRWSLFSSRIRFKTALLSGKSPSYAFQIILARRPRAIASGLAECAAVKEAA